MENNANKAAHSWDGLGEPGLTKREAFAKAAMLGFISAGVNGMPNCDEITQLSIAHADALLAELEKTNEQ